MNVEKKQVAGTKDREALKVANEEYTSCISKDFLSKFLSGAPVKVEDFCVAEREKMQQLDNKIYGKLPFWNKLTYLKHLIITHFLDLIYSLLYFSNYLTCSWRFLASSFFFSSSRFFLPSGSIS